MERQPLVTVATVTALAAAVLSALVAFGTPLNDGQVQAVLGVIAVAAPVVVAVWGRRLVYSPATVSQIRAEQAPTQAPPE